VVLRKARGVLDGGANELIASTRSGGIFSLLLSPLRTVPDSFMRFGLGVASGVRRAFASRLTEDDFEGVDGDATSGAD
jgi:hypothetical protein